MEESIRIILETVQRSKGELDTALAQIKKLNATNAASPGIFGKVNAALKANATLLRDLKIAAAAAGAAMLFLGHKALDAADAMGKQAKQLGILVDAYSKLPFAADINNVSQQELFAGMVHLSKALVEARDPSSKMAQSFRDLGFTQADVAAGLAKGGLQGALLKVSEGFSTLDGDARKAALSMELFSRGGKQFVNFLNLGPAEINKFGDELEQLGAVMTQDLADGSNAVNDNLTRLQFAFKGVTNQVLTALLPGLIALTNALVDVAKDGTSLNTIALTVAAVLKTLAQVVIVLVGVFRTLGALLGGGLAVAFTAIETHVKATITFFDHLIFNVVKVVKSVVSLVKSFGALGDVVSKISKGDFAGAAASFQTIKDEGTKVAASVAGVFKEAATDVVTSAVAMGTGYVEQMAGVGKAAMDAATETKKLLDALEATAMPATAAVATPPKRVVTDREEAVRTLKSDSEVAKSQGEERGLEADRLEAEAQINLALDTQNRIAQIVQLRREAQSLAQFAELTDLEAQHDAALISDAQYQAQKSAIEKQGEVDRLAIKKKGVDAEKALLNKKLTATRDVFAGMAELAETFGKKGFIAAKVFAIASATVNTILAVTQALASAPPPYSFVLAGVVAALGAVQIAKIAGVSFAEGGLVPGTPSATDNRMANVASGEYIFDSKSVAKAGPAWFAGLHDALRNGSFVRGFGAGGVSRPVYGSSFAGGGLVSNTVADTTAGTTVNVGFLDSRNEQREFTRKEGVRLVIDLMRKRGNKVFA